MTHSGGFGPRLFFDELAAALSRRIDHRGAGCVAEEHAGRAVAPWLLVGTTYLIVALSAYCRRIALSRPRMGGIPCRESPAYFFPEPPTTCIAVSRAANSCSATSTKPPNL